MPEDVSIFSLKSMDIGVPVYFGIKTQKQHPLICGGVFETHNPIKYFYFSDLVTQVVSFLFVKRIACPQIISKGAEATLVSWLRYILMTKNNF
jgi:hypothetical protein